MKEATLISNEIEYEKDDLYQEIKREISTTWPEWKKVEYNELFAFSAHATKFSVRRLEQCEEASMF